jgi:hypothetical protein
MASMVYAGKIIKDLGLEDEYTLLVTGTVQEEDCDGLCWQYIIEQSGIRPEFVVSTEPTDCQIYRGQRGRMEIRVDVQGISCHGSAPERGDNAIFKMGPILNELQELYNGKSLVEDGAFAVEVLEHINQKISEYKEEDGNLYAIYGTPAENLCGLQVKQFRKKYGIIEGVSDREYVSNSFHCHVSEDITPIQKQDLENRFWDLSNGGKIQYVKYPIDYNTEAIKTLIHRAMDMGFYEGVNLSLAYCDDCGHQELEMDVCPVCG